MGLGMSFKIKNDALKAMIEDCRKGYPNEACGYLIGNSDTASETFPIGNDQESPTSYLMNPKDQIQAEQAMRQKGLKTLAIYHSHVATEAYPSQRDIQHAKSIQEFFDGKYVLVTLEDEKNPGTRVFTILDGEVSEESWQAV